MAIPIREIIQTNYSIQSRAITQASFSNIMILTNEDSGWGSDIVRSYTSIDEVLVDFSSSTRTYKMCNTIFSQNPKLNIVYVGAEGTRTAQVVTVVFDADIVTGNTITIEVDGEEITQAFSTDHVTTMGALATQIAAIANIDTATVGGSGSRTITITADEPGVPITVGTAVVTGGASQAEAVTTTTTENVGVPEFMVNISDSFDNYYGVLWGERNPLLVKEMVKYIETQPRQFFTSDDDTDILLEATTDDVASFISAGSYNRSAFFYSADEIEFKDAAAMAVQYTYEPGTEILAFKSAAGITANDLTSTERGVISDKKASTFEEFGGQKCFFFGSVGSGLRTADYRFADYLNYQIQSEVAYLFLNNPKLPFNSKGRTAILGAIKTALEREKAAGKLRETETTPAYTVYVPEVEDVPTADRINRHFSGITYTVQFAAGIETVKITGTIEI